MKQIQEAQTLLLDSAMHTALGEDAHTSAAAFYANRRCTVIEQLGEDRVFCAPIVSLKREQTGLPRLQAMWTALWPQVQEMLKRAPQRWPLNVSVMLSGMHELQSVKVLVQPILAELKSGRALRSENCAVMCCPSEPAQWLERLIQHSQSQKDQPSTGLTDGISHPPQLHLVLAAQSLCDLQVLRRLHQAGLVGHTHAKHLPTPGEGALALLWVSGVRKNNVAAKELPEHALRLIAAASRPATNPVRWPSEIESNGQPMKEVLQQSLAQAQLSCWQVSHWCDDNQDQDWKNADQQQARMWVQAQAKRPEQDAWLDKPVRLMEALGDQSACNSWMQLAMMHQLHRLKLQKLGNGLCTVQSANGACAALLVQGR